jgi:hypothetical protein
MTVQNQSHHHRNCHAHTCHPSHLSHPFHSEIPSFCKPIPLDPIRTPIPPFSPLATWAPPAIRQATRDCHAHACHPSHPSHQSYSETDGQAEGSGRFCRCLTVKRAQFRPAAGALPSLR